MIGYLSDEQRAQLLRPINSRRVNHRDGLAHLEAYEVRAHLNRIFGFGRWSADLIDLSLLYEVQGEKTKDSRTWTVFSVGYRATVRLTVCAPDGTTLATYTEAATGDATNFPEAKRADAHDFAIKTAESQAFKRCAINLGDQFGLSLYNKGSMAPLVGRTLLDASPATSGAPEVDSHVTTVAPEGDTEPAPDPRETTARRGEPEQVLPAANPDAMALRDELLAGPQNGEDTKTFHLRKAAEVRRRKLTNCQVSNADGEVTTLGALADSYAKGTATRARAS